MEHENAEPKHLLRVLADTIVVDVLREADDPAEDDPKDAEQSETTGCILCFMAEH